MEVSAAEEEKAPEPHAVATAAPVAPPLSTALLTEPVTPPPSESAGTAAPVAAAAGPTAGGDKHQSLNADAQDFVPYAGKPDSGRVMGGAGLSSHYEPQEFIPRQQSSFSSSSSGPVIHEGVPNIFHPPLSPPRQKSSGGSGVKTMEEAQASAVPFTPPMHQRVSPPLNAYPFPDAALPPQGGGILPPPQHQHPPVKGGAILSQGSTPGVALPPPPPPPPPQQTLHRQQSASSFVYHSTRPVGGAVTGGHTAAHHKLNAPVMVQQPTPGSSHPGGAALHHHHHHQQPHPYYHQAQPHSQQQQAIGMAPHPHHHHHHQQHQQPHMMYRAPFISVANHPIASYFGGPPPPAPLPPPPPPPPSAGMMMMVPAGADGGKVAGQTPMSSGGGGVAAPHGYAPPPPGFVMMQQPPAATAMASGPPFKMAAAAPPYPPSRVSPAPYAGSGGVPPPPAPAPQQKQQLRQQHRDASREASADESSIPFHFPCVLIAGMPSSGKTTIARKLVDELRSNGDPWHLFSGADVQMSKEKMSTWDSIRDVFNALSVHLDELVALPIKGLVLDKNFKTVEEIYYLTDLLKSKGTPLVGIVGLDCSEEALLERMGGLVAEQRERIKYHRVIQAAVVGITKAAGLYNRVDGNPTVAEVVAECRTQVLALASAGSPPVPCVLRTYTSGDSRVATMVENYAVYCDVVRQLTDHVLIRPGEFPRPSGWGGRTERFTQSILTDTERVEAIRQRYGVRRLAGGTRYLLFHLGGQLYLIPSTLRSVLTLPSSSWMGTALSRLGMFIVEGELVRMSRDHEAFLVYEVHYWVEKPTEKTNVALDAGWKERQGILDRNLLAECSGFFPQGCDCVVLHQRTEPLSSAVSLLDQSEYRSVGLLLQPLTAHAGDKAYEWREPSSLMIHFRVGAKLDTVGGSAFQPSPLVSPTQAGKAAASAATDHISSPSPALVGGLHGAHRMMPTDHTCTTPLPITPSARFHTFALEVYNKAEKRYEQLNGATADVRHWNVMEGCIVLCSMKDSSTKHWVVRRICTDLTRPAYKHEAEEILSNCVVPHVVFVNWVTSFRNGPRSSNTSAAVTTTAAAAGVVPATTLIDTHHSAAPPSVPSSSPARVPTQSPPPQPSSSAVRSSPLPSSTSLPRSSPPPPRTPPVQVAEVAAKQQTPAEAAAAAAPASNKEKNLKLLASIFPSMQIVTVPHTAPSPTAGEGPHGGAAAGTAAAHHPQHPMRHGKDVKPNHTRKLPPPFLEATGKRANSNLNPNSNHSSNTHPPHRKDLGTLRCPGCGEEKQQSELRHEVRSERVLCDDCWYLKGHAYCCRCKTFSTGKRAPASARREDFVCHKCVRDDDIIPLSNKKRKGMGRMLLRQDREAARSRAVEEGSQRASPGLHPSGVPTDTAKESPVTTHHANADGKAGAVDTPAEAPSSATEKQKKRGLCATQ